MTLRKRGFSVTKFPCGGIKTMLNCGCSVYQYTDIAGKPTDLFGLLVSFWKKL